MHDTELCKRLRDKHADDSLAWHAAERIKELKRDLNRANQRIGLFLHHASKKKKAKK